MAKPLQNDKIAVTLFKLSYNKHITLLFTLGNEQPPQDALTILRRLSSHFFLVAIIPMQRSLCP